jgi:glycerol-3-phosphate dehydrogenase (NAD(P)+)
MSLPSTIIGAGAWGNALAGLVRSPKGQAELSPVQVWSRKSATSLEQVVIGSELVISAVSMAGVNEVVDRLRDILTPEQIIVTTTKGLDLATNLTPSQIWAAAFPQNSIVVLSGPNLSAEIQQGLPAATVVASSDAVAAKKVQEAFSSSQFRVYTNDDPLGVELGGTVKNVMAIAAGTCDGLGLGSNAKASLLTRGLAEIVRIGTHWGADPETFYGLSGLGDLLATCSSSLSRNYQVGYGLAAGRSLADILAQLEGTAEGVNTTKVLMQIARQNQVELPITTMVDRALQGQITPAEALTALMLRDNRPE